MGLFPHILGTLSSFFQLGIGGAGIRSNNGTIEARNAANTAAAPLSCSQLMGMAGNNSIVISANDGANNAVAEWRSVGGLIYRDWSVDASTDFHSRFALVSATSFLFQGAAELTYTFQSPLAAMAGFSTTDLTASGKVDSLGLVQLPMLPPEGLTLSRNATTPATRIDIAAGRAIVAVGSDRYICKTSSTITKRLDAVWATGSGNGGRFSGTVTANQWWHVFIMRNATGSVDFGFSQSATATDKPTGWNVRRIGSIRTDASSNILDFANIGNVFYWATEREDLRAAIGTTATLYTLSVPPGVSGIEAIVRLFSGLPAAGNGNAVLISSPLISDQAPARLGGGASSGDSAYSGNAMAPLEYNQISVETLLTNTSAQVRARASFGGTYTHNPRIGTIGWYDPRGAA
ncbi:hypothetical protein IFO70_10430 [Phormidium tenue FACHB-886]|nr:hypothetical protein [Phormidium tenue FACHB-886]